MAVLDKELAELQAKVLEAKKHSSQLSDSAAEATATAASLKQRLQDAEQKCEDGSVCVQELERALHDARCAQQSESGKCDALGKELTAARGQIKDLNLKVQRIKVCYALSSHATRRSALS
jgi:chromosome segregation ATPase